MTDDNTQQVAVTTGVNSNPVVTIQSDSSAIPFGIKLNGSNYTIWSQMMELHAAGQGKFGYLTGETPRVDQSDPGYAKWRKEDAIVKGWLVKTMEPDLLGLFLGLPTAAEVWEGVSQMYYDGSDESQIYELRCKATRIKQSARLIPLYFAELKTIWQELDKRRPIKMTCATDIKARRDEVVKDRIYDFLAGLDDGFDNDKVRSDFLRIKPLPGLEESFAYIRREAQRQTIMLSSAGAIGTPSVAMVSKSPGIPTSHTPRFSDVENKDDLHCVFCNGTRHTADNCFKKHGFPDWYLERRKQLKAERTTRRPSHAKSTGTLAGVAAVVTTRPTTTTVQHSGHLAPGLSLISELSLSEDSPKDAAGKALSSSEDRDTGWIIDSGATDHMTYNKSLFQYETSPRRDRVVTANGETDLVTGAGSIALTPSLSLHHTLLVPTLSNNLLSVNQVTEQLDCIVLMFPLFCLLQDIQTREIIGRGTKRGDYIMLMMLQQVGFIRCVGQRLRR